MENVLVKEISREMVRPSSPTPSHLKTFTLSLVDQRIPALQYNIWLLVYKVSVTDDVNSNNNDDLVKLLKPSLSETLTQFYPLAGRFVDEATCECNDKGVYFIQAYVNSTLAGVLSSPNKLDLLRNFFPPQDTLTESDDNNIGNLVPTSAPSISAIVQLAVQVNLFECGGIVIGIRTSHKLLDATSIGTFLKHWAARARGNIEEAPLPDFDVGITAFPPPATPLWRDRKEARSPLGQGGSTSIEVVMKSFIFKPTAIRTLKEKAYSEKVTNPSRFEAVIGFIWEQALLAAVTKARRTGSSIFDDESSLVMAMDMRCRFSPPLPKESMGNLITKGVAKVKEARVDDLKLPDYVAYIREALVNVKDKLMPKFQGDGGEELNMYLTKIGDELLYTSDPFRYVVSSTCRAGFSDADFGFGRPVWIAPNNFTYIRNFIFLCDHHVDGDFGHDDGIEAWLWVEKEEMEIMETSQFLDYASPN